MATSLPILALKEAIGLEVVAELINGERFRGKLVSIDDKGPNMVLRRVHHTAKDGSISKFECATIRGAQLRLVEMPGIIRNAPVLQAAAAGYKKKSTASKKIKKDLVKGKEARRDGGRKMKQARVKKA